MFRMPADTPEVKILFVCRGGYFRSQMLKNLLWAELQRRGPEWLERITADAAGLSGSTMNLLPSTAGALLARRYGFPWPSASRGVQLHELKYGHPHHLLIAVDDSVLRGLMDYASYYFGSEKAEANFPGFFFGVKHWLAEELHDLGKGGTPEEEAERVYQNAQRFIQKFVGELCGYLQPGQ